jgi:ABC-2 type transport system ATP-binding protein
MNSTNVVHIDHFNEEPHMYETPLITVSDLTVRRDRFTLEIPKWTLEPGKVIGLVGPNGAGKTTLLECLAGLRKPTKGEVRVFDHEPWTTPSVRASLGFMSDDMPVFDMRIGPLLRTLSGYYETWDAELVEELLERFKLDPGKKASQLSKGQGTRLRLVTAMAFRPRVLLLDEPASGLDLAGRHALLKSVLDVVYDPTRSVVISSHMLRDVERIADRLLVVNEGRIVKDGETEALVGDQRTLEEAIIDWGAAG